MHFSWLGGTAVKIQAKPFEDDITIVIDPYKPATGSFPRSLTPHIAIYTEGEEGSITLSGEPFVVATSGEYEIKGVLVTMASSSTPGQLVCRLDAEGLSVGFLGKKKGKLSEKELDVLGGVDILCVPTGGGKTLDAEQAVEITNTLEPRMVIPVAFASDTDPTAAPVETFLKSFGMGPQTPEKKLIIKKKDLPQEETRVVVLAKE